MRRYRVLLPLTVHTADGSYIQGEEFEKEFTEEEETANLDSGLLELVPCKYRVVGGSTVFDTDPGGTFEDAMRLGQEALLVAGGHIERVRSHAKKDPEPEPAAAGRRTTPPKKEK